MNDLYLLIKEETDYHTIYGIYDDLLKAIEDKNNILKYTYCNDDDIHIYNFNKNKFYKNDEYKEIFE